MLTFEINKQIDVSISRQWLEKIAITFAQANKLKGKWYFSLAFVDNKTIKKINSTYRGISKVTDVLSFSEDFKNFVDLPIDRKYLGEVVICVPQAKKQAKEFGHSLKKEITRLLVHGLSHLSGYNHEGASQKDSQKMFDFEDKTMMRIYE